MTKEQEDKLRKWLEAKTEMELCVMRVMIGDILIFRSGSSRLRQMVIRRKKH